MLKSDQAAHSGDPSAVERLREIVLDLERAKQTEMALREEATALLEGLRAIAEARSTAELLSRLLGAMQGPLGSDVALVLTDPDGRGRALSVIASTDPGLVGHALTLGKTLGRALGGRVTTLLDTSAIAELRQAPFDAIASLVLLPLAGDRSRALILFGARTQRAFGPRHEQLVKRLAPLANQALREVERNENVARQHRDMRQVLDHIDQGLLMIDLDGRIVGQRSAQLDRWFGASTPTFAALFEPHAPEFASWFELALSSLRDGFMPIEVCLSQMPQRVAVSERALALSYRAIMEGERVDRLLVVISDVTAQIASERSEREQREQLAMFRRITDDRNGVDDFMAEVAELLAVLVAPCEIVVERRVLHTLKGNCALFGLEIYRDLCHAIESELAESLGPISGPQRHALIGGWQTVASWVGRLRGSTRKDVVEVEFAELAQLITDAEQGVQGPELAARLTRWTLEPVARRFDRLAEHARELARRLGKDELVVEVDDGGVRLDSTHWSPFWAALVHAVRNSIDHGIESADERVRIGKPPSGVLAFAAKLSMGWITITIRDDGRGIDWDRIRDHARGVGMPHTSQDDLVAALFADGVTTCDEISTTSGRGIGMGALRQAVTELGGTIEVTTELGAGTRICCRFAETRPEVLLETRIARSGTYTSRLRIAGLDCELLSGRVPTCDTRS